MKNQTIVMPVLLAFPRTVFSLATAYGAMPCIGIPCTQFFNRVHQADQVIDQQRELRLVISGIVLLAANGHRYKQIPEAGFNRFAVIQFIEYPYNLFRSTNR